MASSRKSKRSSGVSSGSPLLARVERHVRSVVSAGDRLVVGLSGGIDSVVLLDILERIARRRRFHLGALHVNHQISPNAQAWAKSCREFCKARAVPLRVVRVTAARNARYDAYRRQQAAFVVLAHNRDDQAETVLLQLLRGGGVKGLAAMPVVRKDTSGAKALHEPQLSRDAIINPPSRVSRPGILRPLLDATRAEIERYALRRRLRWIEDESNEDSAFTRNFLRHQVLPLIARRFPAYGAVLARSAGHFAEAAQLLDVLAENDARGHLQHGTLSVSALRVLETARAKNLLRHFLARCGVAMPGAERLDEALKQVLTARQDAGVRIALGACELRRYAGALHLVGPHVPPAAGFARDWQGQRELPLPELGGVLSMTRQRGAGISLDRLGARQLVVRVRRGGERLQPDSRRPRRSLKNLLQESAMPPWLRERLPLLCCGEQVVWAAGIGVDAAFQAHAGERSVLPVWRHCSPTDS
jgi:tRNA(Ile)-lysidine synthase